MSTSTLVADARTPILARIDELILDLLTQLANATASLSDTSTNNPSSQSSSLTTDASTNRPPKRRKDSPPTPNPIALKSFTQLPEIDASEAGKKAKIGKHVLTRTFANGLGASDRVIDRIVTLLGCADRLELGIVASPRGLVAGDLTLRPPPPSNTASSGSSGGEIKCASGQSSLIPTELCAATWGVSFPQSSHASENGEAGAEEQTVLIVEKEAVFKHLLQQPLPKGFVVITGKGYPDHATRELVRLLASSASAASGCNGPSVRVVGLFPSRSRRRRARSALVPLRNDERSKAVRLLKSFDLHLHSGEGGRQREMERRCRYVLHPTNNLALR
nr:TPA_inf: SPO11 [Pseudozyma tsukubaensis]